MIVENGKVVNEEGATTHLYDIHGTVMVKTNLSDFSILVIESNEPMLLLTMNSIEEAMRKHYELAKEIHVMGAKYFNPKKESA